VSQDLFDDAPVFDEAEDAKATAAFRTSRGVCKIHFANEARPGIGSTDDETPTSVDIMLLQAAVRIEHRRSAELLLRRFSGCRMHTTGLVYPTCIPRHLGAAAAFLGRHDDAHRYYDEALKVMAEMRFRPELALTRLQLAELLLEHYPEEKADALEHLDFAIKEFREMKMQPSLERALKHRS
jgi:hypothetical protein